MIAKIVGHFGGEIFDEPSMTEPNQVMSISEIINRFSLGMDVPFSEGEYDDSDDFVDDPTRDPSFDFLEAHMLEQEIEQRKMEAGNLFEQPDSEPASEPASPESADEPSVTTNDSEPVNDET